MEQTICIFKRKKNDNTYSIQVLGDGDKTYWVNVTNAAGLEKCLDIIEKNFPDAKIETAIERFREIGKNRVTGAVMFASNMRKGYFTLSDKGEFTKVEGLTDEVINMIKAIHSREAGEINY